MKRFYDKDQLIYISHGSVRYNREDIDFLLTWLTHLREGVGPAEPESGYVGGKSNRRHTAPHEAWCQVAAEIDERLRRTGQDRDLVELSYCQELSDEDIAIRYFMPTDEVRRRINSAVSYISSGPCPRWVNCIDCPEYSSCARKKRVGITYREWTRYKTREEGRKLKYTKKV